MAINIYSWGAAEEVTGSKHFLETSRALVQIDCGMFQGRRKEAYEKNRKLPFDPRNVNAVVLTHGHFDHCGNLPSLYKGGYDGPIYATPATRDISQLVLADSAHIQASDAAWAERRNAKKGRRGYIPKPLYDHEDTERTMARFENLKYRDRKEVAPGVFLTFFDAGHILGSAMAFLEVEEGGTTRKILFGGDLGRNGLPILRDPQHPPQPDVYVSESTYGNRLHDEVSEVDGQMAEVVNWTIKKGGKVIIPAFAIGRTQEIVYCLHILQKEGRIPKIPIYIDSPMAIKATAIFSRHPDCYDQATRDAFGKEANPFGFENLRVTRSVEESKMINELDRPAIIISASGMAEAGRILHHLRNNIEDPKNTVLVVGFMAEHTLGRRIVERREKVRIFGEEFSLRARVKVLNAFSAHADYNELLGYLDHYSKKELRKILLVHGEKDAQASLREKMKERGYRDVEAIKYGKKYRV